MEKEKVFVVTAKFKDFDKEGGSMILWNTEDKSTAWKLAFYELWRYQMTWSMAYDLAVIDGRENLFVRVICKEAFLDSLLETMEGIGYRDISQRESNVGLIDCLKVPDDVEMIDIGW